MLPRIVNLTVVGETNRFSPSLALLGVQGEDNATRVVIDASQWADYLTDGRRFVLEVRRPDGELFTVQLEQEGTTLFWDVRKPEIGVPGYGALELHLLGDGGWAKTIVAETRTASELELCHYPPCNTTWSQLVVLAVKDALDAKRYMQGMEDTLDIALYVMGVTGTALFSSEHWLLCDAEGRALFAPLDVPLLSSDGYLLCDADKRTLYAPLANY